jgi:uncharacterized protein YajQ (UPF0234 family)
VPTFDIVSEVDRQEVTNAVDQTLREVGNRYDFRGTDTEVKFSDNEISIESESPGRVEAAIEVLKTRLVRRNVDVKAVSGGEIKPVGGARSKAVFVLNQGIESDLAKDLSKRIRDTKIKVQVQIQGDQLRVSGKKRDDLQEVIAAVKQMDLPIPVQFTNFRD